MAKSQGVLGMATFGSGQALSTLDYSQDYDHPKSGQNRSVRKFTIVTIASIVEFRITQPIVFLRTIWQIEYN